MYVDLDKNVYIATFSKWKNFQRPGQWIWTHHVDNKTALASRMSR